jgi:Mg2+ and Co2+ transporter CorA
MGEETDHILIDRYVSGQLRPKLEHEYISLAHTFSLLKRNPEEAYENLFIIMFMAPVLVGRSDIAKRNLLLLKGLVEVFERQEKKTTLAVRLIEGFYEAFDSVIRKINKVQQLYSVDIDLSFLKDLTMKK